MCTNPITLTRPATFGERLRGISSPSSVQIPCGKCAECMKKKQNSIRFRVYNEAVKRGKLDFLTLTYSNDTLPISQSLWSVDSDGLMILYGECQVCHPAPEYIRSMIINDRESERNHKMKSILVKHKFSEYQTDRDYYLSYSPCHDYNDVKMLLKRIRKWYFDMTGKNADFSFLCVPEFGEHFSRRPHFHMCFFGAPELFVTTFVNSWYKGFYKPRAKFLRERSDLGMNKNSYVSRELAEALGLQNFREYQRPLGFVDHQSVSHVNEDGSDGFAKCSSYVGKYVGKGVFEDSLVKDGFVILPRISISQHFGELTPELVDWHLCRDVFGNYDDETLSGLSNNEIERIVEMVSERLIHSFQGNDYGLPIQFYKQIFKGRTAFSRNEVPSFAKGAAFSYFDWPPSGKVIFSALWYRVADFVRNKHLQDLQREFESFISHFPSEDFSIAVVAFEAVRLKALKAREEIAKAKQRKSLSKLIL